MTELNLLGQRAKMNNPAGLRAAIRLLGSILERPLSRPVAITTLSLLLVALVSGAVAGTLMTNHYNAAIGFYERQGAQYAFLSERINDLEQEVALLSDETAARQEAYRKMIGILESYGTDIPIDQRQEFVQVVYHESMKHALDPILAMAVIKVESTFDPTAVSSVGAVGLMQVIPYVGKYKAQQLGIPWNGERTLYDPMINVQIGIAYLIELKGQFRDFGLALEAYNRGPTAVRNTMTAGINPSRYYANRVMRAYTRFQKI